MRRVRRPWQIYALVALWAIKGFQELLSGVIGTSFYVGSQVQEGRLAGYAFQTALQSVFFSALLAAGSFYVMAALWLGKRAARAWGIVCCRSSWSRSTTGSASWDCGAIRGSRCRKTP